MPNKYFNTALIDADYILWIACNPNKVRDKWGNFKREDGKYVYSAKTLAEAIATCDSYINDILMLTHADSYIMCLTTGVSFRHKLDKSYKANRVGIEKPLWFSEVRAHMIKEWGAIECVGLEADDMVTIIKTYLEKSFIIAADKDILDCIPGKHFDARKGKSDFIEVSHNSATFNFARSLLTGDTIDGIPNLIKGMGPKTAEEELEKRMDHNNPIICALLTYIFYLGEYEGIKRFSKQYQMLKMLSKLEEIPEGIKFSIPEPQCFNCVEAIIAEDLRNNPDWDF